MRGQRVVYTLKTERALRGNGAQPSRSCSDARIELRSPLERHAVAFAGAVGRELRVVSSEQGNMDGLESCPSTSRICLLQSAASVGSRRTEYRIPQTLELAHHLIELGLLPLFDARRQTSERRLDRGANGRWQRRGGQRGECLPVCVRQLTATTVVAGVGPAGREGSFGTRNKPYASLSTHLPGHSTSRSSCPASRWRRRDDGAP